MEYIFSSDGAKKILRTKSRTANELEAASFHQLTSEYPDEVITDNFRVVRKIFSKDDSEGNHYTWYEVDQYFRTVDRTGALAEKMNETRGDLADALCDLDIAIDERITALEENLTSLMGLSDEATGGE